MRVEEKERLAMMEDARGAHPVLALRVDGNGEVGAGHIMRCCAIASAAQDAGCRAFFFVSDDESAAMLAAQGFDATVLGGSYRELGVADADILSDVAAECGALGVLVDTYAATDVFLARLGEGCHAAGARMGYIDDEYRFFTGCVGRPTRLPVDVLVNYGFAADADAYGETYAGTGVELLVGPSFAPLREGFRNAGFQVAEGVSSVLVTTGSTNPRRTLERVVSSCRSALPHVAVHVVVGPNAAYDEEPNERVVVHRSPRDMRKLMLESDLVVSAAGTTLYELASLGVPTIAVPITDNQDANIRAWRRLGLGPSVSSVCWSEAEMVKTVCRFAASREARVVSSQKLRQACDGFGAWRIVRRLCVTARWKGASVKF